VVIAFLRPRGLAAASGRAARVRTVDQTVAVVVSTVGAGAFLLLDPGCRHAHRTGRVGAVDESIAVVVDTVRAVFRRFRVDGGVAVVAVNGPAAAALGGITVAVRIGARGGRGCTADSGGILRIDQAVAVVVGAIRATFHGAGVDRRVAVVTVSRSAGTTLEGVAIAVRVGAGGRGRASDGSRVLCIDQAVAVVVFTVRAVLHGAGVDRGLFVIAVDGSAGAALDGVAVTVRVGTGRRRGWWTDGCRVVAQLGKRLARAVKRRWIGVTLRAAVACSAVAVYLAQVSRRGMGHPAEQGPGNHQDGGADAGWCRSLLGSIDLHRNTPSLV